MDFKQISQKALEIQKEYRKLNESKGNKPWSASEYAQGFVGDVGDLSKLIMAKNNFRTLENVDQKLKEELSDCLYAIIVIASELNVDLEASFVASMEKLNIELEKHP